MPLDDELVRGEDELLHDTVGVLGPGLAQQRALPLLGRRQRDRR